MSEELKTCPFCGGKAEVIKYLDGSYSVSCKNDSGKCNMVVMTALADTEERAIELWNKRAKT